MKHIVAAVVLFGVLAYLLQRFQGPGVEQVVEYDCVTLIWEEDEEEEGDACNA